ncbi:MAG: hypothetical protein AB8B80_09180 [Marinicellaceae bacterium]
MVHFEKHQKIAILIFTFLSLILYLREEQAEFQEKVALLFIFLLPILLYKLLAYLSSFGFLPSIASDANNYKTEPFAFLFWIIYLIAAFVIVF